VIAYPARVSETTVVVLGGSGLVGSQILELWAESSDWRLIAPTHAELDVLDEDALAAFLRQTDAPLVINLAAWADVDGAEPQRGDRAGRVYALNADYPGRLARLCGDLRKHLVHVSTDYVFGGTNDERPYREGDPTDPLCWYAETKLMGEQHVLAAGASACVARIAMPFTARDYPKRDFARTCLRRFEAGQPIRGVQEQRITPVFLDDAVRALRLLSRTRFAGIVHVAASEWTTPYRFARTIAELFGFDLDLVQAEQFETFVASRPARRPQHSWLDVSLFGDLFGREILRPLEIEVRAWADQVQKLPGGQQIDTASARAVR
jgi:dTDP-4-dehydrorhamnose reductase